MSQNPNYRIYKHCLTWAGESFEETKLSKTLIHNLLRNKGGGGCYETATIGIAKNRPISGK